MPLCYTPPKLPLYNSQQKVIDYPVRRIICIGRNYADHAKEMEQKFPVDTQPQNSLLKEAPPFFFYKPLTALVPPCGNTPPDSGTTSPIEWRLPTYSQNVHYETEICIAIGGKLTLNNLDQIEDLDNAIIGAGIALDMTCRDIQQTAKKGGRPWAAAKGFDYSAPCSALMACDWESLQKTPAFLLHKNNAPVQHGNLNNMIWPIPALLAELSRFTQLDVGDLILTGTPAGVGSVTKGDHLKAQLINTACQLELNIV
ncbi:fumarylacetoacetate hydrolase family protein [Marinagarivorans algicola]|uniref:fumarylacetoacetate hydrolase family protein n=1 Tax=Marinagarivorans algicola TaxID=1513270 RepID=UPI0006B5F91B|nr:fumarylacetoacetate hydrolase family protein [Marinagarivorans algicola]